MRKFSRILVIAGLMVASSAVAEPIPPIRVVSPLDSIATRRGDVEIRSNDRAVTVTLRNEAGDFFYKVEADSLAGIPDFFHSDVADVYLWRGNLAVTATREGQAWLFSIPEDSFPDTEGQRELRPAAQALKAHLAGSFNLVEVDTATAITDRNGPSVGPFELDGGDGLRRAIARDTEYQDPGSGGVGSCGKSCNISCGDGSSCQTSCGGNRCASCSCPASCSCS